MRDNIRKNFQKRGPLAKVGYFFYVYEGQIIALSLTLLLVLGITFSMVFKKDPALSVRVLSHGQNYENIALKLSGDFKQDVTLSKRQIVDISNLDLSDNKNQDTFVAQLTGHQVDVILLTPKMDKEMTPLFKKNRIYKVSWQPPKVNSVKLVARVPEKVAHVKAVKQLTGYHAQK